MGKNELRGLSCRHGGTDACLESVVSGAEFLSDLHLLHSSVVFVAIATSCFASVQISMHSQGFQGQSGAN